MKPDFTKIDYKTSTANNEVSNPSEKVWKTPEQIPVKTVYTALDLENVEHLNFAAGIPPFLRGP
jgi:methylmalonyl-CoA mutase